MKQIFCGLAHSAQLSSFYWLQMMLYKKKNRNEARGAEPQIVRFIR
jgi:hypothetical protein